MHCYCIVVNYVVLFVSTRLFIFEFGFVFILLELLIISLKPLFLFADSVNLIEIPAQIHFRDDARRVGWVMSMVHCYCNIVLINFTILDRIFQPLYY